MATRIAAKTAAGVQPRGKVGPQVEYSTWSVGVVSNASIASAGDVIQMIKVPAGATPVYVAVSSGAGMLAYTVGDTVSVARYLNMLSGSTAQAQIPINVVYVPYTYSADSTIDITIGAVSTASLVGGFNMVAIFAT